MFDTLLVANRGEIACRVIRTARAMGLRTVAVYSDADRDALHVRQADTALRLGSGPARDSYLNIERVIDACRRSGAGAVHPGYGFLSENADFARACREAGIVFVGPSPEAIDALGHKAAAKQRAESIGVPCLPGYTGKAQDNHTLIGEAKRIGAPLMIKASAGGGGRGMRRCDDVGADGESAALEQLIESARAEALASFGNGDLLLERLVEEARHVEVQVFGDTHGGAIHLGERDCSTQRRNQKILEEAPAPGVSAELRARMGEAAVKLVREVGYVGAGTVEFLLTPDGEFHFLEMNTRLQVEHPVTEAITGQDLVEWQLRVASGEPLPLQQDELRITGHAIEARICAENPDNNFLPATGALNVYGLPECVTFERGTVRVDSGVRQGDAISPFYDSMVAKLIVHGDTREQALARLDEALAQTHIVGLATNVQFLRRVARTDSFARAQLDTALIPREQAVLFHQEPVGLPLASAAAVAQTLLNECASEGVDPFSRRDGFHTHGVVQRRFEFEFGGEHAKAWLTYERGGSLHLAVGEGEHAVAGPLVFSAKADGIELQFAGQRTRAAVYAQGEVDHVFTPLGATQITAIDLLAHAGEAAAEGGRLTAPMPGKVVSFAVKAGDAVTKGQPLAVMEAMKMEHTIAAPADGVVQELLYAPGDQVTEGAELLKLVVADKA